ncbi:MAG: MerR family transcriptional regulator [Patescibacteria group bacterium]|nr:MerR family transcriptional regulator [Patescibacteria group bacterium]
MNEKPSQNFFIPRGDAFDIDFAKYENDDSYQEIRELMSDRRFTVGKTDISYRVINHWDQSDILPEGSKSDGGWRKFTFPEIVWLRAIARLRKFGLSLEKIERIKKQVMFYHLERYPYFEYYLVKAWISESDSFICTLSDGEAETAFPHELEASRMINGNFDVLLVSLKSILEAMGMNTAEAKRLFGLSDEEIELLASLRLERNSEINAKMNSNGEIAEIESTKTFNQPLDYQIRNQIKKGKMFGKAITQYEDGIPKSIKVTKRQKFKK